MEEERDADALTPDPIAAKVNGHARGRTVHEWKAKAGNPDDLWFDCLVGCAVAAAIQGAMVLGTGPGERFRVSQRLRRIRLACAT